MPVSTLRMRGTVSDWGATKRDEKKRDVQRTELGSDVKRKGLGTKVDNHLPGPVHKDEKLSPGRAAKANRRLHKGGQVRCGRKRHKTKDAGGPSLGDRELLYPKGTSSG